jgi:hypothetical protein
MPKYGRAKENASNDFCDNTGLADFGKRPVKQPAENNNDASL